MKKMEKNQKQTNQANSFNLLFFILYHIVSDRLRIRAEKMIYLSQMLDLHSIGFAFLCFLFEIIFSVFYLRFLWRKNDGLTVTNLGQ